MDYRVTPEKLSGSFEAPISKSELHRHIMMQMLSGKEVILPETAPEDCLCTYVGMQHLLEEDAPVIDCKESGSTLRFLLPLAAALGKRATFLGTYRLLERPTNAPFPVKRTEDTIEVLCQLKKKEYLVNVSHSSQILSGMLMALPLLPKDTDIMLTEDSVSWPYVELTIAMLEEHGITIERTETGYHVPGNQTYLPKEKTIGGDWSGASCLLCAGDVKASNLDPNSMQGDKVIASYIKDLPETVDIRNTPDLLPALVVLANQKIGKTTTFVGGSNLRIKESNRLKVTCEIVNALGGEAKEGIDGLTITGRELDGDVNANCYGDHRMIMMAACLATQCKKSIIIKNADKVGKSYPEFFEDYMKLGGKVEETNNK